jgi:hypothetical protein
LSEPLRVSPSPWVQPASSAAEFAGRLTVADAGHPLREAFEAFVETRFAACFDARLRRHYPRLVGLVGRGGAPRAVAGVRFAEEEPLFLERYLDAPIEEALAADGPGWIERRRIVEIGSLASEGPCAAIGLFHQLAAWLRHDQGRRIAVATVTPRLERLLQGAGFDLTRLAGADPVRLGGGHADWGGYYQSGPAVFAGEILRNTPALSAHAGRRRLRSLRP